MEDWPNVCLVSSFLHHHLLVLFLTLHLCKNLMSWWKRLLAEDSASHIVQLKIESDKKLETLSLVSFFISQYHLYIPMLFQSSNPILAIMSSSSYNNQWYLDSLASVAIAGFLIQTFDRNFLNQSKFLGRLLIHPSPSTRIGMFSRLKASCIILAKQWP